MQVVIENKRQMCISKLAKEKQEPWLWWQFTAGYSQHCTMANGKFGDSTCADTETRAAGIDTGAVSTCMGDNDADATHPLLQVAYLIFTALIGTCVKCLNLPCLCPSTRTF